MKKKLLGCLLLLLAFASCQREQQVSNIINIPLNLSDAREIDASDLFESIEYVPLETKVGMFISMEIQKVSLSKNYIVLFENDHTKRKIYVFDRSGNFLWDKKDPVDGPQSFIGAYDLRIDEPEGKLMVLDGIQGKMLYFDLKDGRWIENVRVPQGVVYFCPLSDKVLFTSGYSPITNDQNDLHLVNKSELGKIQTSMVPIPNYLVGFRYTVSILSAKHEESVLYWQMYTPALYRIGAGGINQEFFIEFDKLLPGEQELLGFKNADEVGKLSVLNNPEYTQGIRFAHENESCIFFTFFSERTLYWCSYDKKEQETKILYNYMQKSSKQNDIDGGPILNYPVAAYGDQVVFSFQPYDLTEHLSSQKEILSEEAFNQRYSSSNPFLKIAQSVSPYDNPILAIGKLKKAN